MSSSVLCVHKNMFCGLSYFDQTLQNNDWCVLCTSGESYLWKSWNENNLDIILGVHNSQITSNGTLTKWKLKPLQRNFAIQYISLDNMCPVIIYKYQIKMIISRNIDIIRGSRVNLADVESTIITFCP